MKEKKQDFEQEYQYGFKDKETIVFKTPKGLNEEIVQSISSQKSEPSWMTQFRLKSYHEFTKKKNPSWGPDLSFLNFDDYTYFIRSSEKLTNKWEEVPETIKNTFEKLGIPEAEHKFLAGVSTYYESEAVYHNMLKEVNEKGVIFLDIDTALKEQPELFKKYFNTIIPYTDNKYAALNGACWSGGSFIYVPKGVHLDKPLQSYFRINAERMGQFERTLIIVDDDADLSYVEGCTAPIYSKESLHVGVVEIYVGKRAHCRYTTIQNWSDNIINLVTQRAKVMDNGFMEWIDGNIGSKLTMKYPCCLLAGSGATGSIVSIAVARHNQYQDSGAKAIHLAPKTRSMIVSKSVVLNGGVANYRGQCRIGTKATDSRSHISCDTLLLDDKSGSDTIPWNEVNNNTSIIEHEATVSKLSEEQLFYLMSRGLSLENATSMVVMGFLEPFTKELPMEYAVELNRLMKISMEGSVG
ncbi:MAG: Fe-S cluster assembly protein SufB [Bacilli bacterium]